MIVNVFKIIYFVFISLLFLFSLSFLVEWWTVGVQKNYDGYAFGLANENSWFYETPQLYAKVILIEGLLLSSLSGLSLYFFVKKEYSKSNYAFIFFVIAFILMIANGNLF